VQQVNTANGHLESVLLENIATPSSLITQDGKLCADFFIDCSGSSATLIGDALGVSYITSDALATDSSISMVLPTENASPATRLSLAPAGWQSDIATQQKIETRYFFNHNYSSPEQAVTWLLKSSAAVFPLNNFSLENIKSYQHHLGKRQITWHKNCVAIGESAGNLESFVIGKLHFAQSAVLRLLSLFPATTNYELNCQEYNRLTDLEFEHISDFHRLHYKFASNNSSFWKVANKCHLSERNQYRLALFNQRATIPFYENETVSTAMWASFLLGNNYIPMRYDPLVDGIDSDWVNTQLDKMQKMILSAAQAMPTHAQYLKRLTMTH
jgi:tryptophan halogenase